MATLAAEGGVTDTAVAPQGAEPADATPPKLIVLPPELQHEVPYPGFRPFEPDEFDLYFGRDAEIDRLLTLLESRFIAVLGPSGCGKSSLVRAGFMPRIATRCQAFPGAKWRFAEMRPGTEPRLRLAEALVAPDALGPEWGDEPGAVGHLSAILRRGPLGLVQALAESRIPKDTRLVVLVDQFEELFRHRGVAGRDEVEAFVGLLTSALQENVPLHVVITMRSDFVSDCSDYHGLAELISSGMYLTPRMGRRAYAEAIEKPARLFGGDVEPELVTRLLNEVGGIADPLPPLQHVLMRLWRAAAEERPEGEPIRIKLEHYAKVGTLSDALSLHANEASSDLTAAERAIAEVLFRTLVDVTPDGRRVRRSCTIGRIAARARVTIEEVERVANEFVARPRGFLVRSGLPAPNAQATLDISHESLIRLWDRLRGWIDDEARWLRSWRLLRESTTQWEEEKRNSAYLHRGRRLRDADELVQRYPGELTSRELDFIDASTKALFELETAHDTSPFRKGIWLGIFEQLRAGPLIGSFRIYSALRVSRGRDASLPQTIDDGYPVDLCVLHTTSTLAPANYIADFLQTFHSVSDVNPEITFRRLRVVRVNGQAPDSTTRSVWAEARYLGVVCSSATQDSGETAEIVRQFQRHRAPEYLLLILATGDIDTSAAKLQSRPGADPSGPYDLRGIATSGGSQRATSESIRLAALLNGKVPYDLATKAHNLWRGYQRALFWVPLTMLVLIFAIVGTVSIVAQRRRDADNASRELAEAIKQEAVRQASQVDSEVQAGLRRAAEVTEKVNTALATATVLAEQGKPEQALTRYDEALRILAADGEELPQLKPRIFLQRGALRLDLGDYRDAIDDHLKAIAGASDLEPTELAQAHFGLARAYDHRSELEAAIGAYGEVINREPNNVKAYMYRGVAKRRLKQDLAAIEDIMKAMAAGSPKDQRLTLSEARSVLTDISKNSTPDAVLKARESLRQLSQPVRLFIHYWDRKNDSDFTAGLGAELEQDGFFVRGLEVDSRSADVRVVYFYPQDESSAKELARLVKKALAARRKEADVKTVLTRLVNVYKAPNMFALFLPKLEQL